MAEAEIPENVEIQSESSLVRKPPVNQPVDPRRRARPEATGKTIKGKAIKKELTFGEKLKRSFVKEDVADIRDYIMFDVIIPGIQKSILDMVTGTIAQMFGMTPPTSRPRPRNGYSGTSMFPSNDPRYRDYTQARQGDRIDKRVRYDRHRVTDVVFEYKEDAESLLEQMMDICDNYGWFSVFEFYDKAGIIDGNDYTNYNYGWRNVDDAQIRFDGSGYVIQLPPARERPRR